MLTLHLGVSDLAYADSGQTTGDVAEILEAKYGIFATFWKLHQREIIAALENAILGSFESVMSGAPPPNDPHAAATNEIEKLFQLFLDRQEMDFQAAGVPTEAARKGVSHRLAHPYAKDNPERPSFIDTGLYQSSMKAWID